jgi:hypothetical protein
MGEAHAAGVQELIAPAQQSAIDDDVPDQVRRVLGAVRRDQRAAGHGGAGVCPDARANPLRVGQASTGAQVEPPHASAQGQLAVAAGRDQFRKQQDLQSYYLEIAHDKFTGSHCLLHLKVCSLTSTVILFLLIKYCLGTVAKKKHQP